MRLPILIIALTLSFIPNAFASDAVEHRAWNKSPIRIILPIGQERRIDFPGSVQLDLPSDIGPPVSAIEILNNGSVYWSPKRQFRERRVRVRSSLGRIYLLDVSAEKDAPTHPIVIVDPVVSDKLQPDKETQPHSPRTTQYDYVDLLRFAAREFYAPERLRKPMTGISRFPIVSREEPLYRGAELTMIPLAQWRASGQENLYVTAVRVNNDTMRLVEIDPRMIRGNWLATASQHNAVGPKGSTTEETTLYLISSQPFQESTP